MRISTRVVLTALVTAVIAPGLAATGTGPVARAATGDGSVTDSNIAYVGRWDRGSTTAAVPNWTGGYFAVGFTAPRSGSGRVTR